MGACSSCFAEEDQLRSKKIDVEIRKEKNNSDDEVKLLLLGAGESGKSTIFKQMKIIHQDGFTEDERKAFKRIVHSNTLECIKILVEATETLGLTIAAEHALIAKQVEDMPLNEPLTVELAPQITRLWKSEAIQTALSRASEFQLPDSSVYYLDDLDRITHNSYVPTEQDILRTRVRTTGIVETDWRMDDVTFKMFDVGGQRNERRKWIHCFDNVTAVIFVAALSAYDLKLYEDETQNRMHEALNLFDQICNSRWFQETAMILFLNKKDIFEQKIQTVDLTVCFPDYTGGCDYQAATQYINHQFHSLNRHPTRQVYTHLTCATSTDNIKFVFDVVKDIVMQNNLRDSGF